MVVGKPCLLTIFYDLLRASFCAVIACERARLVSKMVLISGGGPTPLVGVGTCDVFCLPTLLLSCIKPVFLSVYERLVLQNKHLQHDQEENFFLQVVRYSAEINIFNSHLEPPAPKLQTEDGKITQK